ncbi:MAG: HNH endonuclease [Verrucomicrobiae bacterium]|nr:HNH endonuclease [Verrucomicrobiae bacterium]
MNPRYPRVAARAGHHCEYCGAPEVLFNLAFEVEHIVPRRRGGGDEDDNLALACRACNLAKGDAVEGWDEHTGSFSRLFHPRVDRWEDHFRLCGASGGIEGITMVGRATVVRLKMNREIAMNARQSWMRLGILPLKGRV